MGDRCCSPSAPTHTPRRHRHSRASDSDRPALFECVDISERQNERVDGMSTKQPPRDFADSAAVPGTPPRTGASDPHADTMARGRVAAVIPVFRAGFLVPALQSVMRQTRPPDEVIVVDDGSPDRAEIAAAVARFGNRVTLVEQANLGAAAARNRGMTATNAEFIALLDADDEWFPAFLEEQLAAL